MLDREIGGLTMFQKNSEWTKLTPQIQRRLMEETDSFFSVPRQHHDIAVRKVENRKGRALALKNIKGKTKIHSALKRQMTARRGYAMRTEEEWDNRKYNSSLRA